MDRNIRRTVMLGMIHRPCPHLSLIYSLTQFDLYMTHLEEPDGKASLKKGYDGKFGCLLSSQAAHSQCLTPSCDHICKPATYYHTYCVS